MSFLRDRANQREQERLSHIRPEILALAKRGDVTWDEYSSLRANSYEQEELYPALTDDAMIRLVSEIILPNCSPVRSLGPATTYSESLVKNFVPLLLERLSLLQPEKNACQSIQQN